MRSLCTAVLAAAALVPAAARSQLAPPYRPPYEGRYASVETFTAPAGASVLTAVLTGAFAASDTTVFGVYQWTGSDLAGAALFRTLLPPSRRGYDVVGLNVPVTPGTTYAVASFFSLGNPLSSVGMAFRIGTYAGGQAYDCRAASGCTALVEQPNPLPTTARPLSRDGFLVAFDDAPLPYTPPPLEVVPEPAPAALAAAGLAGVGALAARRRRGTATTA